MHNVVFEGLYWSLGGAMLVAFVATVARSVADLRRPGDRTNSQAILAVAVGALLALVVGFTLNSLRPAMGDLVYQQFHFVGFYLAFGLVLWGFDRAGMTGARMSAPGRVLRPVVWGAYLVATAVAVATLLAPDGYRVGSAGGTHYAQLPQFFLPLFVALAVGAAWLPRWRSTDRSRSPTALAGGPGRVPCCSGCSARRRSSRRQTSRSSTCCSPSGRLPSPRSASSAPHPSALGERRSTRVWRRSRPDVSSPATTDLPVTMRLA